MALYSEAPYSHELNSGPSGIRTRPRDPRPGALTTRPPGCFLVRLVMLFLVQLELLKVPLKYKKK